MKNKQIITGIVVIVVVGAGAFYGGMTYAKNKTATPANFANMTPEQRQQMRAAAGAPGAQGGFARGGNGTAASFVSGEIISKDDKSLTVKLPDGGSKIVLYSETTPISKAAQGSSSDLEAGKQIMVSGKANSDGSVNAASINLTNGQLLPGTRAGTPPAANMPNSAGTPAVQ